MRKFQQAGRTLDRPGWRLSVNSITDGSDSAERHRLGSAERAATADSDARRLYRFGRTDIINVLTADAAAAAAQSAIAQARAVFADDQITLFQTLGGAREP